MLKAFSEEIGHANKECAAIAFKSRLGVIRERAKAFVVKIVVVADIKSLARRRTPAEQKLARRVRT